MINPWIPGIAQSNRRRHRLRPWWPLSVSWTGLVERKQRKRRGIFSISLKVIRLSLLFGIFSCCCWLVGFWKQISMFSLLLDLVGFFRVLRKMLHILLVEKVDVTHFTSSMCLSSSNAGKFCHFGSNYEAEKCYPWLMRWLLYYMKSPF